MSSLLERLRAHRVLDVAEHVAARADCAVEDLEAPGAPRAELAAALEELGWHPTNVARVLGDAVAPRAPRAIPPPPPSSTRLAPAAAPRARRARLLGPVRAPEPVPPLRPLTAEALGLERADDDLEDAGYGARVDLEELEREPLPEAPARRRAGGGRKVEGVVVDLFDKPRMFPGRGERYDNCVHASACLGRAVQADPGAQSVHCPRFCKDRKELTRDALIHLASAGKAQGYT